MSDETSPRLALPLLQPGQAQKELYHNEALALIDLALPGVVRAVRADPPDAPALGAAWIVGPAPSGAWGGQAGAIAGWTGGGWRFIAPVEGMALWLSEPRQPARFLAGSWRSGGGALLGETGAAIADPSGGAAPDSEARAAIAALLALLRRLSIIAS